MSVCVCIVYMNIIYYYMCVCFKNEIARYRVIGQTASNEKSKMDAVCYCLFACVGLRRTFNVCLS